MRAVLGVVGVLALLSAYLWWRLLVWCEDLEQRLATLEDRQ